MTFLSGIPHERPMIKPPTMDTPGHPFENVLSWLGNQNLDLKLESIATERLTDKGGRVWPDLLHRFAFE